MAGYGAFARHYNRLTGDVDYRGMAAYVHQLAGHNVEEHPLLLDLACGTGQLSIELARLGYEVIGVDASPDMLAVAAEQSRLAGVGVLYLCQRMEKLDLYGTVDAAVCTLDSVNHVTDPAALQRVFDRVALFLSPGGLFVFDANTPHKHREVLGDNAFVREAEGVFCVWQNRLLDELRVEIALDFFEEQPDGRYGRRQERFFERAYPREELEGMLRRAGFREISVFDDYTSSPPGPGCQRYVFAARK